MLAVFAAADVGDAVVVTDDDDSVPRWMEVPSSLRAAAARRAPVWEKMISPMLLLSRMGR